MTVMCIETFFMCMTLFVANCLCR